MTTKPKSHIQFEPLILPRKTPAEELSEVLDAVRFQNTKDEAIRKGERLLERLQNLDAPKKWDGVYPCVDTFIYNRDVPIVRFSDSLRLMFAGAAVVYTGGPGTCGYGNDIADREPYHDGVVLTITAGDGTEDVKVLRGTADDRWLYLALGEHSVVLTDPYGDAVGEAKDRWPKHCEPLPPGTVTRITINNTLPTTEQRYSVEVVEPEKPKFAPITVANERVKVGVESEKICMDYLTLGGSQIFNADEAREIRDALSAALEFGDPTQEQPGTEVALEIKPEQESDDDDR